MTAKVKKGWKTEIHFSTKFNKENQNIRDKKINLSHGQGSQLHGTIKIKKLPC